MDITIHDLELREKTWEFLVRTSLHLKLSVYMANIIYETRPQNTAVTDGEILPVAEERLYDVSIKQDESLRDRKTLKASDNMGIYFELNDLDSSAFKSAFFELIKRHEILRTSFVQLGNHFKQKVCPFEQYGFEIENVDVSLEKEKYEKLVAIYTKASNEIFDIERGPLMKAILCKLAKRNYIFIFIIDHIICDAWSFKILIREHLTLYKQIIDCVPPELPPLKIQFKEYAASQRKAFDSVKKLNDIDYWRDKLKNKALKIDFNRFRKANNVPVLEDMDEIETEKLIRQQTGRQFSVAVDNQTRQLLHNLARRNNSSLFSLLVTSFNILLQKINRQTEILIATPISDRLNGVEELVGNMMGTIYLYSKMDESLTVEQCVKNAQHEISEAADHIIYNHKELDLAFSFLPLTSIFLNFIEASIARQSNLPVVEPGHFPAKPYFVLECFINEYTDGLLFSWRYNSDFVDECMSQRLADNHQMILAWMVRNLSTAISECHLLE